MTTGPGRETPGEGTSACVVRQTPSLDEALEVPYLPIAGHAECWRWTMGVLRAVAWRKRS